MNVNGETLQALAAEGKARLLPERQLRVTVGTSTCGRAAGACETYDALEEVFSRNACTAILEEVGCRGLCFAEPLVEVYDPSGGHAMFGNVGEAQAALLASSLIAGGLEQALRELPDNVIDPIILEAQERRVMSNCGEISPTSLTEYLARGGYSALVQALRMRPDDVVKEVMDSGLRGRGGAGFPTGLKWQACAAVRADERFVIVNGDEGDPGAYMDRGLLESDPHRVLEGALLACYAVGARKAYFFVRAEYPLAVDMLRRALSDAQRADLVGRNVLGTDFSVDVELVRGAGAFLCGESTALVNVLENGECTTRRKPPHLTEKGLWGKPTCVNNVETLANVPLIVERGARWFRAVGTEKSPGTKIFSVTGSVSHSGLVEIPLGVSLAHLVSEVAGAPNARAVQIGGPSGAILPSNLDVEVTFEGLEDLGGMMGSGGFVVMDGSQCVVEAAAYLTKFSDSQSCGRCRPCREGLREASGILERATKGRATEADMLRLKELAESLQASKLCGLGRTALSPALTAMRHFPDDFAAHVRGECPTLACRDLVSYEIIPERCQGERCCLLTCPGNAIKGPFGKAGRIVDRLCQKCGMCAVCCPYAAVRKVTPAR